MNKKLWISGGCLVLFIILSVLIVLNLTVDFDVAVYNFVTMNSNDTLTSINKIFTFLGSTLFIIILACFFFFLFLYLKKKNYAFIVAFVIILSTIANNVIKVIIRRGRPSLPLFNPLVEENTFSFPSGHTMASVSLYGILLYLVIKSNMSKKKKIFLSIILIIIPLLVGLSRIYLGAHFATDIIGAALMSLTLLLIEIHVINKKEWI